MYFAYWRPSIREILWLTVKDYTDLACELKIGSHKNIVNLMGACTLQGPLWVILEFCPHGDLQKFIRMKKLVAEWEMDSDLDDDQVDLIDLLRMTMEIAEGMIFLSHMGIVHRDLAARNILREYAWVCSQFLK